MASLESTSTPLNAEKEDRPMRSIMYHITPVRSDEDIKATRELFYEYTQWLNIDLNFQFFASEMATFPGKYTPSTGELLLARTKDGNPAGCVALRSLSDDACEMKRLYVNDSAKGLGIGKALALALIRAAKDLGYRYMRLDSLPRMTAALKLYRSLGFTDIKPYYETPLEDTVFLELDLDQVP